MNKMAKVFLTGKVSVTKLCKTSSLFVYIADAVLSRSTSVVVKTRAHHTWARAVCSSNVDPSSEVK
jgi:hypothetical protein